MAAASASHYGSRNGGAYFRSPPTYVMLLIVAGMGYYSWAVFAPATIPYDTLGPLGTFTEYLVKEHNTALKTGYLISWSIHVGEALYSLKLCKGKGVTNSIIQLLWFIQTLVFGGFSLYQLWMYNLPRKASEAFKQKTK